MLTQMLIISRNTFTDIEAGIISFHEILYFLSSPHCNFSCLWIQSLVFNLFLPIPLDWRYLFSCVCLCICVFPCGVCSYVYGIGEPEDVGEPGVSLIRCNQHFCLGQALSVV